MEGPTAGRGSAGRHRVVEGESNVSCGPLFAGGVDDAAVWSEAPFFLAGHTTLYSAASGSLFLFGGYDGSKRTNDLYVLRNAKSLAAEGAESAELVWEKATLEGVRDRAGHGFFMKDEKLYIHAGYDSQHNVLHDLVEVDVSSDGFSTRTMEYKSVLPNLERRWHCNFLHDDRYFVHGGWNDSGGLADLIYLDLNTQKWAAPKFKGTVPSFRRWHTMTQLSNTNGRYFLFGGYNGGKMPLGDAFLLNIVDDKQLVLLGGYKESDNAIYKEIAVLHTGVGACGWSNAVRSGHSATLIEGEGILVCGGWKPDYIQPAYWIDLRMTYA
ncbi:kelch domain containing 1, putative [Acanthamoeba castellanii str. Neff]|uniref:Kelch domain containing 1, putative n=1 Tax=Acanthamoeba castellanii (strain ATCC 30010 / Neff) TaxID=1257118 RepID=L8HK47_ACACF|nr:kelch domain containing 1, putative [Acanthamoeba castellanii str. Neff]ELR25575.1 kelch domain containing 1, putative [Acanthamoeba castellanii str. Neff]